jgi:glycosyltransferase involved in cell wall biosynthesis
MKLAWFTPFNVKSAIGQCSKIIVDELARECEVHLWVHDDRDLIETDQTVVHYRAGSETLRRLESYDHRLYCMGNYYPFHGDIYETMQRYPGVVILHDFLMHHFFMVYYLHELKVSGAYVADMERFYGLDGRQVALQSLAGASPPIWLTNDVIRYPLFERLVQGATGVMVHSRFHREQIRRKFLGEIGVAYLPYRAGSVKRGRRELCDTFSIPADRVLAVSTGIVHPVKRMERVLEAMAAEPGLRERLMYVVIGDGGPEYRRGLETLADDRDVAECVRFLGYQPGDVLHDFLAAADFSVNLRFPNSEGCSLSLVEQMSCGKPAVVLDSGVYAEMPDEAVIKVPVDDDGTELRKALTTLVSDSAVRGRVGAAAREFASSHFTPEAYASGVLDYLSRRGASPAEPVRVALAELSAELAAGYPIERGSAGIEPLLREVYAMVNGRHPVASGRGRLETLGVWLAFEHYVVLHREGITRFLCYLLAHLIERYGIACEIWCYAVNEASVREAFRPLLFHKRYAAKVRVVHERNVGSVYRGRDPYRRHSPDGGGQQDLSSLANAWSLADCFLIGICYLDNALPLDKPLFVPLHDLVIFEHYAAFVGNNEHFRPHARQIKEAVEAFNRRGAFFFCNSDYVRRAHLMRYIAHVDEDRTRVVYLPPNIPRDIERSVYSETETRARHGITKPYFFYPTQIRPHKNVLTLVKAFHALVEDGLDVELVLTGSPDDVPEVGDYVKCNPLASRLVVAKDVPERNLYSLHAHAVATVVPTRFEGGFPWQALEAMLMNTPAIVSRIPAVTERLTRFEIDSAGLRLFDPDDVTALTRHMRDALVARDEIVRDQEGAKAKLFRYSWNDVADAYFRVIEEHLRRLGGLP